MARNSTSLGFEGAPMPQIFSTKLIISASEMGSDLEELEKQYPGAGEE